MIGFYNYTVLLTYISLVSASTGIVVSLMGNGHPYLGMFFMLFSALCDAFDGKVARLKKDRTEMECRYGIQIDSLSDVVAFGVLPAVIGVALAMQSEYFNDSSLKVAVKGTFMVVGIVIMAMFVLAALIRLAYFNVTEEQRQEEEDCVRKYYLGLPVTVGALILPIALVLHVIVERFSGFDLPVLYFLTMLGVAIAFVSKFKLRKPGMKKMAFMIIFGLAEIAVMIVALVI
jgi:CDP-diacylglycerol--serine O-phosphatidyltransferase